MEEIQMFRSGEFRSLAILGDFLDPSNKLYENVELFLGVLAKAAVCMSVESVVESCISVIEAHDTDSRNLDPNRLEDELICLNGRDLSHSQSSVKEAMINL